MLVKTMLEDNHCGGVSSRECTSCWCSPFTSALCLPIACLLQTKDYPPWRRSMEVWYDLANKRSKIVVHEGFEAGKTFLRRWDATPRMEYMWRDDEYAECRRAYLSELMPVPTQLLNNPELPLKRKEGSYMVESKACLLWVTDPSAGGPWSYERVKVYVEKDQFVPMRVVTEFKAESGRWIPTASYTFNSIVQDGTVSEEGRGREGWREGKTGILGPFTDLSSPPLFSF